ncbi:hypothetical protein DFA_02986 [Cavenderia fasciculata]|uniref:DNA replication complex GINS protein PSF1 n=1 Tax=Cavenderia fasciculata TaxID=261658 RepID=F4PGA8_CACFS|nr:uncharacterized protein DFA_02986 [Cavenderia fasciculata]EGG24742.1 hypothetical protein DFA_02986 [Cavenderia fasciculata]|eukprot:XP_004362593.1 hypothetical protein DFA_02986 [Cavenderia fasciculata]
MDGWMEVIRTDQRDLSYYYYYLKKYLLLYSKYLLWIWFDEGKKEREREKEMYTEKAIEILRELRRSESLPLYNEAAIKKTIDEIRALEREFNEYNDDDGDDDNDNYSSHHYDKSKSPYNIVLKTSVDRNKRCILAYLNERLERIKEFRWNSGSGVLDSHFKEHMSVNEIQFFTNHDKLLAEYHQNIGMDLTVDINQPPKDLLIEVRVIKEFGEVILNSGATVNLKPILPSLQQQHIEREKTGLVAVLMLLLLNISYIHCEKDPNTFDWPTSEGGNGHTYKGLFLATPSITEAIRLCEGSKSSTFKSYLVTIESKQEWDFIKTNLSTTAWVSGKDIRGIGNYTYSSGPGTNQPLFNMYTGQCWGYCPFDAGEPSLTLAAKDQYIYIRRPTWNFNNDNGYNDQVYAALCEIQPISEYLLMFQHLIFHVILCLHHQIRFFCQLETSLNTTTKLLPISISVDDVYTQTYKPYILCDKQFHSTILFGGEYETVNQVMIDKVKMGATPNAPYIGAIESEEMYQCFSQSLNIKDYHEFRFWQGVSYNSSDNSFTRNNGPLKGTPSPLYYNDDTSNVTPSNNILYNINDRTVSSKIENVNYCAPLITFHFSDAPMIDNITSIIPGQASQVTINGNHFGKDSSYVLISIQGSQCKSPMFIENNYQQISCSLGRVEPYSTDLNYTVKIGVGGMLTTKVVSLAKECLNNCSSHGILHTTFGSCKCNSGHEPLLDCSELVNRSQLLNTTVWDNGMSLLSTDQTISGVIVNFTTGIQFIREINHDKSVIKTLSIDNLVWTQEEEKTSSGELDIQVSPNSIKCTVKIINWVWSSPINTLQVIFHTQSDSVEFDKCGKLKVRSDISRGDQIIWTRVQVGRTLLNCKIASRMVIDNSTIIPSKVTLLTNDDPVAQQIWKSRKFNLLTTFHIPRFSQSVELDPVFNALILGDDSNLPYECTEETSDQWTFIIVAVVLSAALLSIIVVVLVIVFIKRPPTNRPPNREAPIEMDIITSTEDINTYQQQQQQQQQNNNEY